MKRSYKINKIYNDIFIKESVIKPPFMIYNVDDRFYINCRDKNNQLINFETINQAKEYIYTLDDNPIILVMPFFKKTTR